MDANYRLLLDQYNKLKDEIDECKEYLDSLKVPTNGIDPDGKLGYGKRENLTLLQRIKFMKYEKSRRILKRIISRTLQLKRRFY